MRVQPAVLIKLMRFDKSQAAKVHVHSHAEKIINVSLKKFHPRITLGHQHTFYIF